MDVLEGDYTSNWTVVIKFPSEAAARAWYDHPDYQSVIPNRLAVTDAAASTMVLAPAFRPPS